jgi:hypothetical protein
MTELNTKEFFSQISWKSVQIFSSSGQANMQPHYLHHILGMQRVFCFLILEEHRLWYQTWIKQIYVAKFHENLFSFSRVLYILTCSHITYTTLRLCKVCFFSDFREASAVIVYCQISWTSVQLFWSPVQANLQPHYLTQLFAYTLVRGTRWVHFMNTRIYE